MKIKIGDFRRLIDTLNWARNDLSGHTSQEFYNRDVPEVLDKHISKLYEAIPLVNDQRFPDDMANAIDAIAYAHNMIQRWDALHEDDVEQAVGEALYVEKQYRVRHTNNVVKVDFKNKQIIG